MNFAKIVATIGPASESVKVLTEMVENGLSVARLNFSHGTHEEHGVRIKNIRTVAKKTKKEIAILADMCGPKIRVGEFAAPITLVQGSEVIFSCDKHTDKTIVVQYAKLAQEVMKGTKLMLDDGKLSCVVTATDGTYIQAKVVVGGELKSRKGINVIGGNLSVRAFTDKDKKDVLFAAKAGVDCVALSFVRSPKDILEIKAYLKKNGYSLPVIAKVETQDAIDVLEDIVKESDGIMIARGDLAIEVPTELVPQYQQRMIDLCRIYAKPCITATQMLDSMVARPVPTRAEVSDVSHAITGGTDCVMLSEESAAGKYPIDAVQMMNRIGSVTEMSIEKKIKCIGEGLPSSVARAALELAVRSNAKAIVTLTETGSTTRLVSAYRLSMPILAISPNENTRRFLQLSYAVETFTTKKIKDLSMAIRAAKEAYKTLPNAKVGDTIILLGGMPFGQSGGTNFVYTITL